MSFTEEEAVTEQDALACAAGLGCEGLAVSQDEALVLTGHNRAETALEEYRNQFGEPDLKREKEGSNQTQAATPNRGHMSFTEDEVGENAGGMSFDEEEVRGNQEGAPTGDRFTSAEIASFTREEDELWACAAAFGCKGAAADLTPHEALHLLGLPQYSYEWPLAACAANASGACDEMGLSMGDALRIMSHLANPNR
ncbi:hypothetical protein AB2N04_08215 [Nitratireductor sp. GISD-1A_MAKvit]|uniref:hypothetical protein n=1 Tax=Nitratireductor sp. GISD-1A_MAKvit TaxID=3234198 RepID=UPI003465F1AD